MALPGFLEDTAKDYATQSTAAYKTELQPSTFMGSQFVAGEDPLQTKAIDAAQAGVGAYAPYLASAATNVGAAGTAQAGLGALSGAQAYQPFMSPYQQDVIDTSLASFDKQAAQQQQALRDQSLGVPGAFGGGREGVQQADYQSGSDLNRAALEAQMRQQNFQQAQQGAQTAFGQQQQMAQGQLGLLYEKGNGVRQDYSEAAKWYRKAADQGSVYGQISLGYLYEKGNGVNILG